MTIKISGLRIGGNRTTLNLRADVEIDGSVRECRFHVTGLPNEIDTGAISADSLLVSFLVPAMERGANLQIEGPVSPTLLHTIRQCAMRLLRSFNPQLKEIEIDAHELVQTQKLPQASGAATALTGGIDSTVTILDYLRDDVPNTRKISFFLFHNVGSHGNVSTTADSIFGKRVARIEALAAGYRMPLTRVTSNIYEFYKTGFAPTHTIRNAAAAHLVAPFFETFLYSSTFDYDRCSGAPGWDMGSIDPMLLPLLSNEHAQFMAVGSEYTRFDKTLKLLNSDFNFDYLDICIRPSAGNAVNCGRCVKCGRFLAIAEHLGKIDRLKTSFDVEAYFRKRSKVLRQIARFGFTGKVNPNDTDVYYYLRDNGFGHMRWQYATSLPYAALNSMPRLKAGLKRLRGIRI